MTPPSAMFIVGALLFAAGGTLWFLQRCEQRREGERRQQSPFDPADGHQQTQELRRRFGL